MIAQAVPQDLRFADDAMLWLVWIAPAILLVGTVSAGLARRAARRFIHHPLYERLAPSGVFAARIARTLLVSGAALLIAIAIARPQSDPELSEVDRAGRDVCFVLDVSRSMLAQDVAPNRLDRAKMWIEDALSVAGADRVGLVAFAGDMKPVCPLTRDTSFFRMTLKELSPDSVDRGGTMIGDALRLVMYEVFDLDENNRNTSSRVDRFRDVILLTDGEDHGSFPVEAAAALGNAGVRLIIIGIGSEKGAEIPIQDEEGRIRFVRDQAGDPVVTHLDSETLSEMALATPGGRYFPVADGTIRLDDVYQRLIRQSEQNRPEQEERFVYQERFQIFLLAALSLLFLEPLLAYRGRKT